MRTSTDLIQLVIDASLSGLDGRSAEAVLDQLRRDRLYALLLGDIADEPAKLGAYIDSPPSAGSLAALRAQLVAAERLQAVALAKALAALELAGVQPVILKGRALALSVYDAPWHRPHGDVDLYVDASDVERVHQVLDAAGFQLPYGVRGRFTSHQFLYTREILPGVELALDVHWKLSNRHHFAYALTYREARLRATPLLVHGVVHRLIHPADALLHAAIHLQAHHHDEAQPLIWLYDMLLLTRALSAEGVRAVTARAETVGAASVFKAAFERTLEIFGTESLPALDLSSIRLVQQLDRDGSAAFLSMSRRAEIVADLRSLRRPLDRVGYVRELIFPPGAQLLERYGYTSRAALPLAWVRRGLDVVSRNTPST